MKRVDTQMNTVITQVLIMALLILTGFICFKLKIVSCEVSRGMSELLITIVNPAVILMAYQIEFSREMLIGLLVSFALAVASHLLAMATAAVFIRSEDKETAVIERLSCMYTNCGFMGIPLVNGTFGTTGVFYLTAYLTVFNLLFWTHGAVTVKGSASLREVLKALRSPSLIAILIGLVFFLFGVKIPSPVSDALQYIATLNTPLAMIVAGVTIARGNIIKSLVKPRLYLTTALRLLIVPAVVAVLYALLPVDGTIAGVNVLLAACPTGALVTVLAVKYNKNSEAASELFGMTTLLSIATIPLIMALFDYVSALSLI